MSLAAKPGEREAVCRESRCIQPGADKTWFSSKAERPSGSSAFLNSQAQSRLSRDGRGIVVLVGLSAAAVIQTLGKS